MDSSDLDSLMTKAVSEAILSTAGIDKKKSREQSDKEFDRLKSLENENFNFRFFMDLVSGTTKAEAKAVVHNVISKTVSDKQLRMTTYIFFKAMYEIAKDGIDGMLKRKFIIEDESAVKDADRIADTIKENIMKGVNNLSTFMETTEK